MPQANPAILPEETGSKLPLAGILHLMVVYFVWGTTYLGIRVAVRDGAGFAPFALGATRLLVAGSILLAAAFITKQPMRLSKRELRILGISAVMMWNGGNGLVMVGETKADSGYAALLISTTPVWAAIIETVLNRKPPTKALVASLITGLVGLAALSWPNLAHGGSGDLFAILCIVIAPMIWAGGSVIQQRSGVKVSPLAGSGYQQIVGGLVFILFSLIFREPFPHPTATAWMAWGYLVIFGSLFAFTSYTLALKMLPMSVLMTYAYVNPLVAVILGWAILGEKVGVYTMVGTALVLLSVAGTFKAKRTG